MRSLKPQSPCMLSRFLERMAFVASGFGGSVRSHTLHMPLQLGGVMLTPVPSISCSLCLLSSSVMGSSHRTSLPIQQLCDKMDKQLFLQILDNHTHVLHQLLPPRKDTQHSLRPRAHNRIIPPADAKFKRNLIIRMLYLNSY